MIFELFHSSSSVLPKDPVFRSIQTSGTPHQFPFPKNIPQHQLQVSWDHQEKLHLLPTPLPKHTSNEAPEPRLPRAQALSALHCCVQVSMIGDASKKLRPHQLPKSLNPKPSKLSRWVCASWTKWGRQQTPTVHQRCHQPGNSNSPRLLHSLLEKPAPKFLSCCDVWTLVGCRVIPRACRVQSGGFRASMPTTNCARNLASHYLYAERGKTQSPFRFPMV